MVYETADMIWTKQWLRKQTEEKAIRSWGFSGECDEFYLCQLVECRRVGPAKGILSP